MDDPERFKVVINCLHGNLAAKLNKLGEMIRGVFRLADPNSGLWELPWDTPIYCGQ
jgi:hypothetical protein